MRLGMIAAGGLITGWCALAAVAAAPPQRTKPAPRRPAAAPARPAVPTRAPALPPEVMTFFEREVRPVLAEQCYSCHGPRVQQAGLRLDSRAAALRGGASGPAVLPGKPAESLLVRSVRHQGKQMPPGRKLPDKQLQALERWVQLGAPWPGDGGSASASMPGTWEDALRIRRDWWSLQPVRNPAVPVVRNRAWSADPVDRYLLSALERKGLQPAPRADERTLVRRVHLLLTGLPPAPEEVEAYAREASPRDRERAYTRLVDRALASPQFGERWARHWMDVIRFGETHGYEWNYEIRDVWRYRDYLIRAFNADVPYDQLVREHLAGDLLPNPRTNREERLNESRIATAFFRFGEVGHDVFKEIGLDHLDNMIDTLSKAFQATTVSCARCHDHKLDAVSTKDYYALLGILASSRQVVHTVDDDTVNAEPAQRLRTLKAEIRQELADAWRRDAADSGRYLQAAQAARDGSPETPALAQGLDAARLQAWKTALEKKGAGLEDLLTPWQTAADAARSSADVGAAWRALADRAAAEARDRAEHNGRHFVAWGDFRQGVPEGWRADGLGLRGGAAPSGEFAVAPDGDRVVTGIFPAGLYTHTLSERMNGAVQSPYMPPDKRFVSVEVLGGRSGQVRQVPDFRLIQDSRDLSQASLGWVQFGRSERDERAYLELATKLDSAKFPNAGGRDGGTPFNEPRSYFGVTRAFLSDQPGTPKDELAEVRQLFGGPEPADLAAAGQAYAARLAAAAAAWAEGRATDGDARWLDWLTQKGLVANTPAASPRLADLLRRYRETEKQLSTPRVVAGMADLGGFDHPVYVRGDFRNVGEAVRRRYLEVLSGTQDMSAAGGSGRLALAEEILSPANPLTARVMVNRVWHYLFGTGLVRTTDDFGHMGEPPSHPELLDYLATRFVKEGWSIKRLIRSLVLTQAFRMSGADTPRAKEIDPENRLLNHFPARRLEAEAIRDSILAVSGRLDRTLYGPSIQPYRVEPMPERRLYPGPLDGQGRRSVYTKITLMQGPTFLEVFNFPDPKTAMGRRDVTNVPAQALTMLNDPFVVQQAEVWADRLIAGGDATVAARVDRMFRAALGRAPRPSEAARFEKSVQELAALHQVAAGEVLRSKPVWKDVAHALFNVKEFIYVR